MRHGGRVASAARRAAPERAHVEPGTPLETVNHGTEDLVLYAYGTPPEDGHAEILDPAL